MFSKKRWRAVLLPQIVNQKLFDTQEEVATKNWGHKSTILVPIECAVVARTLWGALLEFKEDADLHSMIHLGAVRYKITKVECLGPVG